MLWDRVGLGFFVVGLALVPACSSSSSSNTGANSTGGTAGTAGTDAGLAGAAGSSGTAATGGTGATGGSAGSDAGATGGSAGTGATGGSAGNDAGGAGGAAGNDAGGAGGTAGTGGTGGACAGQDCSQLDTVCTVGTCGSQGVCIAVPRSDTTTCDDGNSCTTNDHCNSGVCFGAPVDCSGVPVGACQVAACDPNSGACVVGNKPDNTSCDDGDYCTLDTYCTAGVCGNGATRDCSGVADQCNTGVCDTSQQSCVKSPQAGLCDDGDACTVNDTCNAGTCTGTPLDCTDSTNPCMGICDPSLGCVSQPTPDATACDDGDACTSGDACLHGVCVGNAWLTQEVVHGSGLHPSLALDSTSVPHVSFLASTSVDFATRDPGNGWSAVGIGSVSGDTSTTTTSLGLDGSDHAYVAWYSGTDYYLNSTRDLRYATNASGSWVGSTRASSGDQGGYASVGVDANGDVHISYFDNSTWQTKYMSSANNWAVEVIETVYSQYPSALAMKAPGQPGVAYMAQGGLKLAVRTSSNTWSKSTIQGSVLVNQVQVAFDSSGNAHVCYDNNTGRQLRYATNASGSWVTQTVESVGGSGSYFSGRSIAVDGTGVVHISYDDPVGGRIRYAQSTGTGWKIETASKPGLSITGSRETFHRCRLLERATHRLRDRLGAHVRRSTELLTVRTPGRPPREAPDRSSPSVEAGLPGDRASRGRAFRTRVARSGGWGILDLSLEGGGGSRMSGTLKLGSILVVDDEQYIRKLLQDALTSIGYEVDTAEDGSVALARLRDTHYDLVIADLRMPGVAGDDLLESIRESGIDTDVLMISGAGSINEAVQAMKYGARSFLEKPFTLEVLKKEVRAIFRARAAEHGHPESSPPSSGPDIALVQTAEERPHLGPYELVRVIGRGGMGRVYEAYDPRLKRSVAIKTMLPEHDPELRAELMDRFKREGWVTGQLSHPNIAMVFDFGEVADQNLMYLVMELVGGPSLRQLLDSVGTFAEARMLNIALQVATALEYAHGQGVIHRDVKPENILVAEGDRVKLVDFGIAKIPVSDLTGDRWVGSPAYFSPELVKGKEVDYRADQFALGTVMIEMLSGRCIFDGSNVYDTIHRVAETRTPRLGTLGVQVGRDVEETILRLHQKDPRERFPDERELVRRLGECIERRSVV